MAILSNNQRIGNYEVKRLIRENNYCETYRVEDEKEEPFFLKLFILKNTPEKMLDEHHKVACIDYMSKLRHKNIVSYIERGTYSDEQVGECEYVITNYFSGELLADKLTREGCLSLEETIRIIKDVLDGLKFMHERNLFHNDITPRNIMLSERTGGAAELIDMSHVSKYVGGSPSFDTSDLDERYQSNTTFAGMYNNATDLFSVVALFYTMLTNRVPWDIEIPEGTDRKERVRIVKEARKTPLNLDDLQIDDGYKRILQKGLFVNGTCKYADAELLIGDLQNPNRVNELEKPKEPEQPRQQSTSGNNTVDEEKQATEAKVGIQKGKGNGCAPINWSKPQVNHLENRVRITGFHPCVLPAGCPAGHMGGSGFEQYQTRRIDFSLPCIVRRSLHSCIGLPGYVYGHFGGLVPGLVPGFLSPDRYCVRADTETKENGLQPCVHCVAGCHVLRSYCDVAIPGSTASLFIEHGFGCYSHKRLVLFLSRPGWFLRRTRGNHEG